MKSIIKPSSKHVVIEQSQKNPEVGLILMDLSLTIIAIDPGAAMILNSSNPQASIQTGPPSCIPKEILEIIRTRPADLPVKTSLRMGENEYTCRAYLVESINGFLAQSLLAIHLERVASVDIIPPVSTAVSAVAAKYNLTERERQALLGVSMGLSSKELAERMKISPNTVKVFLRLIMIKMGVSTRGGIVARILEYRTTGEERHKTAGNGAF